MEIAHDSRDNMNYPLSPSSVDHNDLSFEMENLDEFDETEFLNLASEMVGYEAQEVYDLPTHEIDTSPSQGKKTPKNKQVMSDTEWITAIDLAIQHFRELPQNSCEIDLQAFTIEKGNRFTVKTKMMSAFLIFPWFHTSGRYRQTLNSEPIKSGVSIEMVLKALNFFIQRGGTYSEADFRFFEQYYRQMTIPIPSSCLSSIVEVYHEFEKHMGPSATAYESLETEDITRIVERQTSDIQNLAARVTKLERVVSSSNEIPEESTKKRARQGGDRACYFPIRPCDFPTRDEWCHPGEVFGLYSDGVGRLLPIDACYRRSVVVYSVDPDTEEAHPDPEHPERYLLVVMVGEAPVRLREDQFEKLVRWNCNCDVFVNHFGDVCVRKFERDPPHGGTVFATTSCINLKLDKEGYPVFQGTRGVCAKIFSPPPPPNPNTQVGKLFHRTKQAIKSIFVKSKSDMSLLDLMQRRQTLFGELAKIKRQYNIYQDCLVERNNIESAIQRNEDQIALFKSNCHDENVDNFQSECEHYRKSIADLTKANEELVQVLRKLESKSLMDPKTFEAEKARIKGELDRMNVLIKDYVKNHRGEY